MERHVRLGVLTCVAVLLGLFRPALAEDPFPREWYWGKDAQWTEHLKLLGTQAPAMKLVGWINGELTPEDMQGKIVVVDLWATWCGPCKANLPKGNDIMSKYGEQGVLMLGVCSSSGQEKMKQVAEEKGVKFPMGKDARQTVSKAFGVEWWPTYAVVDRKGDIRAIGLQPQYVDDMVDLLLKEQPAEEKEQQAQADPGGAESSVVAAFPADWLEGKLADRAALASLVGAPPPALSVGHWMNSQPLELASLRGKVVLLDFWATWCGPCIASIPKMNELQKAHAEEGLVIIGVCHTRGGEKLADTVAAKGIEYAVAVDANGQTIKAYGVHGFPDYYLIDRSGTLRAADVRNDKVADAVKLLLAEEAPQSVASAE